MKQESFLKQKPSRWIALLLIATTLTPSAGPAQPKQPAPEVVRSRVLQLGVGQRVRVREQSGVKLEGEITSIGPRLFEVQERNAAEPTAIYYTDVAKIRCARSEQFRGPRGESWAGTIVIGAVLTLAFVCGDGGCLR